MHSLFINHNGKLLSADVSVLRIDNRAFRYGWGVFETILVREDHIKLRKYHWERLLGSAVQIGLHLPALMDGRYFEGEVLRTVRKNKLEKLARVRLQVYNGNGGLMDDSDQKAGFIIECFPIEDHITEFNEIGLVTGVTTSVKKAIDSIANLKTSSALIYAIAAREAKSNRWNDALILNIEDRIIESTIANIFWLADGIVHTPPLSEGCIAGVMRRHLMNILPHSGINLQEIPLSHQVLKSASGVFLTNAVRGIKWIHSIDGQVFAKAEIEDIYGRTIKVL